MPDINVIVETQTVQVNGLEREVTVVNAAAQGPAGIQGPPGPNVPVNELPVATGTLNMNGSRITGVADATANNDVVNLLQTLGFLASKADDNAVVHLAGNETLTGVKTTVVDFLHSNTAPSTVAVTGQSSPYETHIGSYWTGTASEEIGIRHRMVPAPDATLPTLPSVALSWGITRNGVPQSESFRVTTGANTTASAVIELGSWQTSSWGGRMEVDYDGAFRFMNRSKVPSFVGALSFGGGSVHNLLWVRSTYNPEIRTYFGGTILMAAGRPSWHFGDNNGNNGTEKVRSEMSVELVNNQASRVAMFIQGAVSQTGNLQEWRNSAAGILARVNNLGEVIATTLATAGGSISSGGSFTGATINAVNANLTANASTLVPLILKGAAGQTADLQQWQNNFAVALLSITAAGDLLGGGFRLERGLSRSSFGSTTLATGAAHRFTNAWSGTVATLAVDALASQTADIQQWRNSTAAVLARITSVGALNASAVSLVATSSTQIPLVVQPNIAGSTVDLAQFLSPAGAVRNRIASDNRWSLGDANVASPVAWVDIRLGSTDITPLYCQGGPGQTADLQQWRDSAMTVLSRIASTGAVQVAYNIPIQAGHSANGTFTDIVKRGSSNDLFFGGGADVHVRGSSYLFFGDAGGDRVRLYSGILSPATARGAFLGDTTLPWGSSLFQGTNDSSTALILRAGPGTPTADVLKIQTNANTDVFAVEPDGDVRTGPTLTVGGATGNVGVLNFFNAIVGIKRSGASGLEVFTNASSGAGTLFTNADAGANTVVIKGATGHTGDLQQWQNVSATVLTKILPSGNLEFMLSSLGPILRSPTGIRYRITVDDTGALATTAIT